MASQVRSVIVNVFHVASTNPLLDQLVCVHHKATMTGRQNWITWEGLWNHCSREGAKITL